MKFQDPFQVGVNLARKSGSKYLPPITTGIGKNTDPLEHRS